VLTVVLSLAAALSWGFHDFLIQPATRRVGAFAALFWVLLVSTVVLMVTALAVDGLPSGAAEWRAVGIAAGGGITYVLGVATLFHALEVGKLSLVTPLVALMGGVAALAAFVLGERVGLFALLALPLAVAGAVMASIVREEPSADAEPDASPGPDGSSAAQPDAASAPEPEATPVPASQRGLRAASGAGWALLGALLFGTTFLLYGYAGDISPVSAAGWGRFTGLLVFLPLALLKVDLRMPARVYWRTTTCAVLDSGAYVAMTAATALGPIAIASALSAQFATVAVILGLLVRRERPTHVQLAGVGITIVAVVLFSLAV
jgi:drug/metabolite transporter (DMT)-like permease